ncbi:MAG: YgfZ/GcvT domain-containing protein [Phycisphaerales bacterium]
MARVSPLHNLHQQAEASISPYGPPEAGVLVVETFGELELEYAALRKGSILLDEPQRSVIEVRGGDRQDFLNRMLTQELGAMQPMTVRRSFWLNRKGRIDADLRVIEMADRTLLDLDTHALERTIDGLRAFIVAEDVTQASLGESMHRLSLHGPGAAALLDRVASPRGLADLAPDHVAMASIAGRAVVIDRDDATGDPGFSLSLAAEDALVVYQQLLEAGHDDVSRPAGWHAFNIARIEAGRPLYYLDFGPTSLPHETGVLRDRVSFTKGCYLGQEIVARMESRGHSKPSLVALRTELVVTPGTADELRQPATGGRIFSADAPDADPIGLVTSSAVSPMLGSLAICFAMVRPPHNSSGSRVLIEAPDAPVPATVQPSLPFWSRR